MSHLICQHSNEKISEHIIPSIQDEEQKFLGKIILYSGKSCETIEYFKKIFSEKLNNINNMVIRDEYKMWIYKFYFLPSMRFLLTVHEITQTHLLQLDTISNKFMKKWTGIPICGTNVHIVSIPDVGTCSREL